MIFDFFYFFHLCFICRPFDSLVPEDAQIEPRAFATLALAVWRSNHAAVFHPLLGCEDDLGQIDSVESLVTDTNVLTSVPDPWHFGVDPDPQIHASVRIRCGSGSCYFRYWP